MQTVNVLSVDDVAWARFVEACPGAMPFHHPQWCRLLTECYGYRQFVFALEDEGGAIVAGVPVLDVQHPLGGRRWVSLPFTDICPPLAASGDDQTRLVAELETARQRAGLAAIEIRADLPLTPVYTSSVAVIHDLKLDGDAQSVYRGFHRSQVQRNIGRAEREGVIVRRAESIADLTNEFYRLHLQTRRRQGTPVQPRRFFRLLWNRMIATGLGHVLLAYSGDVPIAGAVFLTWNGAVTYKFGASDPDFWKLRPNHLIFWTAIRWACENGYRRFDFGRTDLDNRGLRAFKSGWGAEERPLIYSTLADRPPKPSRGGLHHAIGELIRRSPPWVCRAIGELLYKYAA